MKYLIRLCAAAWFMTAGTAFADPLPHTTLAIEDETLPTQQPATPRLFASTPLEATALQAQAGREDVAQIATSNSNATVARNSVGDNSRTGDATIDGAAFQNLSGLSMVNVNTGNNVAMNSSMNVNISITPGP